MVFHFFDGSLNDPFRASSPATMDSSNNFPRFIDNKNRKAIRCPDDEEQSRKPGNHGIALQFFWRNFIYQMNDIRMNLVKKKELKTLPFFFILEISFFEAPCSKAMDKEGNLLKARDSQKIFSVQSHYLDSHCPFINSEENEKSNRTSQIPIREFLII
jgi:hypothetical protein